VYKDGMDDITQLFPLHTFLDFVELQAYVEGVERPIDILFNLNRVFVRFYQILPFGVCSHLVEVSVLDYLLIAITFATLSVGRPSVLARIMEQVDIEQQRPHFLSNFVIHQPVLRDAGFPEQFQINLFLVEDEVYLFGLLFLVELLR